MCVCVCGHVPNVCIYKVCKYLLHAIYSIIFIDTFFAFLHIDGLVQERRNPIANALELRLSCTNPSISYFSQRMLICCIWLKWDNSHPLHDSKIVWLPRCQWSVWLKSTGQNTTKREYLWIYLKVHYKSHTLSKCCLARSHLLNTNHSCMFTGTQSLRVHQDIMWGVRKRN